MTSARRRLLAGAALVGVGWLLSPHPVPVYDGLGAPDEPYRYVSAPAGATKTAAPTSGTAQSPVKDGVSTNGLSVATGETGPQFSLYLPPQSMAAAGGTIEIKVEPKAPSDQPAKARIDGNVYSVQITDTAGPVTLTKKAAIATLYLRATTARQPPPVLEYRASATQSWKSLQTSRGGSDVYVSSFSGPGDYAVAFSSGSTKASGGRPVLVIVLVAALVVLVAVVLVVRLRPSSE